MKRTAQWPFFCVADAEASSRKRAEVNRWSFRHEVP